MKNQFHTNWASNEKEMCIHRNIHQNNINVFIVLTYHLDNIFDVAIVYCFKYLIFLAIFTLPQPKFKKKNFKKGMFKIVMSHSDKNQEIQILEISIVYSTWHTINI